MPGESPQWDCHTCGLPGNFAWRVRCRGCDAIRRGKGPTSVLPANSESSRNGQPPSLAERQIRQIREEQRKQKQADAEEKRQLREALSRMRAAAAGKKDRASVDDDGDEDGDTEEMDTTANVFSSWTEEERQKKLEEIRGALAFITSEYGEDSEQANNAREKVAAIQRASRDAKPFKAHRGLLERKLERLREKQTRDEGEVARVTAEMEELEAKRKTLKSTIEERSKQITEAEGELTELVKKALAEGEAAGDSGRAEDNGAAPWSAQAASVALQQMASRPGVPPEFALLLNHVFQAAQALANAATPTRQATEPCTAEGSESNSHRGSTHQQQQPQQQGQPPRPAAAAGPSGNQGTNTGAAAAGTGGKGSLSSEAAGPLAPQGRWSKGASSGAGESGGRPQEQRRGEEDEMQVDSSGPSGGQTTASGTDSTEDNSEELVEEEAFCSGIDDGVAASINKLPKADQRKLKAALGARGGRRRAPETGGGQDELAEGNRDRERSPRPTKGSAAQNEA